MPLNVTDPLKVVGPQTCICPPTITLPATPIPPPLPTISAPLVEVVGFVALLIVTALVVTAPRLVRDCKVPVFQTVRVPVEPLTAVSVPAVNVWTPKLVSAMLLPLAALTPKYVVPAKLITPALVTVNVADVPESTTAETVIPVPATGLRPVNTRLLLSNNPPLAYNAPPTPTPPDTYNALLAVVDDAAALGILTIPLFFVKMLRFTVASEPVEMNAGVEPPVAPDNFTKFALLNPIVPLSPTTKFRPNPRPPAIVNAPVAVVVASVLLLKVRAALLDPPRAVTVCKVL